MKYVIIIILINLLFASCKAPVKNHYTEKKEAFNTIVSCIPINNQNIKINLKRRIKYDSLIQYSFFNFYECRFKNLTLESINNLSFMDSLSCFPYDGVVKPNYTWVYDSTKNYLLYICDEFVCAKQNKFSHLEIMESTLLNIILQKHLTYGFYISVTSSDFIFLAKNEKDIYFFNYETGNLKSVREMSVSEFKKLMGTRNR